MKSELHVPSDLRFLIIVENWLLSCLETEFGERMDWPQYANRFRLVLAEAYSNVVRHAHREQPHVPVLLRLELRDQAIALEIWDQGDGYDPDSEYIPPNPADLPGGGYGWLIIQKLMDRVEYSLQVDGKNCLKLETNLPVSTVSTPELPTA
jgi:serine/threonine-protein kinase RsbW